MKITTKYLNFFFYVRCIQNRYLYCSINAYQTRNSRPHICANALSGSPKLNFGNINTAYTCILYGDAYWFELLGAEFPLFPTINRRQFVSPTIIFTQCVGFIQIIRVTYIFFLPFNNLLLFFPQKKIGT